jgi:hypothetical protein
MRSPFRRWSRPKSRLRFSLSPPGLPSRSIFSSTRNSLPPEAMCAFAETVLWCSRQDLRTSSEDQEYLRNREMLERHLFKEVNFAALSPLYAQLRSPELQPSIEIGENTTDEERENTVAKVIGRRSQLLATGGSLEQERILSEKKGRLLVCWPAENVSDGASQVSSLGFFDPNDIPPWDTWIHYGEGRLNCWVPDDMISLAQNGLDANMVQCIQWADEWP